MKSPRRFAMSVDVEDYFQVWAFCGVIDRASWDQFSLRVERSTHRVLDNFDRRGVKATFFTLGWVAERAPSLIREIVRRGHELASHGYGHVKVSDQTPNDFRGDILKAKALLEDIGGVPVIGYRAPSFSIDQRTPWAYQILGETGHLYSSSVHPIAHDHYGDPNASRTPYRVGSIIEAPVATAEIFGRRVSCAGGGWFRATPYAASRLLLKRRANEPGAAIFYFHPWEIDADQPRVPGASSKAKLRHYLNLRGMEAKLDRLFGDFLWSRIDDALDLSAAKSVAA